LVQAKNSGQGNLIGFIYAADGSTPVEGAVLLVQNVATEKIYRSTKTDKLGIFKIQDLDEGLYIAGVSTEKGDFNMNNVLGIRANETAKLSLALKPEVGMAKDDEDCPKGKFYVPDVDGECEKGYKWNGKKKRCDCEKRKGIGAFFGSPFGIAAIAAGTGALIYGVTRLTERDEEASAFKK
jgi:hypothetical protein